MKVALVDLDLGNLRSVARAIERAGGDVQLTSDPEVVARAPRLVVPGQGGFSRGASALAGPLGEALREAIGRGAAYLGLCLGMQLLFDGSDEAPGAPGLGIFPGRVERFPDGLRDAEGHRLKVPHMGWNEVEGAHPVLPAKGWFYFVHSFRCIPDDPAVVAGTARYPERFCAAVARDNVVAVQFHPEKSHREGVVLLERFLAGRPQAGGWS